MKVKELIKILEKMDPEIELYTWDSSYYDNPVGMVGKRNSLHDQNYYIF